MDTNWFLEFFRNLAELHGAGSPFAYKIAHSISFLFGNNVPDSFQEAPFMVDFAKGMIAILVLAAAKIIWDELLIKGFPFIMSKVFVFLKMVPPTSIPLPLDVLLELLKLFSSAIIAIIGIIVGDTWGDFFVDTLLEFLRNIFPNASDSGLVLWSFIAIVLITSVLLQVLTYLSDSLKLTVFKIYPLQTICCQFLTNLIPSLVELFTVNVLWVGLCLSISNREDPIFIFGAFYSLFFVTLGTNLLVDYLQTIMSWYYTWRYSFAKMSVNFCNILVEISLFATFLLVLTLYTYDMSGIPSEMQAIVDSVPLVSIISSDLSFATLCTANYDFALIEFAKAFLMFLIVATVLRLIFKIVVFKTPFALLINFFGWLFGAPMFVLGSIVVGSLAWLAISSMTFMWAGITCIVIIVVYCIISPPLLLHAFIDAILIFSTTGLFISAHAALANSPGFDPLVLPLAVMVLSTFVFIVIRSLVGFIAAPFDWTI